MAKFMEIKSINPKIRQSEKTKELKVSFSTKQRYRREIKLFSHYRIPQSSNTKKRKTFKRKT